MSFANWPTTPRLAASRRCGGAGEGGGGGGGLLGEHRQGPVRQRDCSLQGRANESKIEIELVKLYCIEV